MASKPVSLRPTAGVAFLVADRRATRWRLIEWGRPLMSSEYDPAANRRRFLQYLAASPLLAAGGAQALAETILPKTMGPDPLMWGPRQPDHLIKSLTDAVNDFDFVSVCRQNLPPASLGYKETGTDEELAI